MHRIIYLLLLYLANLSIVRSVPTTAPTTSKSSSPSMQAPTEEPSAFPTAEPTDFPTRHPSAKPSHYPSKVPTIQPSVSFYPTSMPTTNDLPRYYQCSDLVCQGNSESDCYYTTGNVILEVNLYSLVAFLPTLIAYLFRRIIINSVWTQQLPVNWMRDRCSLDQTLR